MSAPGEFQADPLLDIHHPARLVMRKGPPLCAGSSFSELTPVTVGMSTRSSARQFCNPTRLASTRREELGRHVSAVGRVCLLFGIGVLTLSYCSSIPPSAHAAARCNAQIPRVYYASNALRHRIGRTLPPLSSPCPRASTARCPRACGSMPDLLNEDLSAT